MATLRAGQVGAGTEESKRTRELRRSFQRMEEKDPLPEATFTAVSMLLIDAIREHDEQAIETALESAKRAHGHRFQAAQTYPELAVEVGRLLSYIDMLHWARVRSIPLAALSGIEPESHAFRFLEIVQAKAGITSSGLAAELGVGRSEISRTGKRLLTTDFVRRRRVGRQSYWEITPAGGEALRLGELLNSGFGRQVAQNLPIDPSLL